MSVGENIRRLRTEANLTQEELAHRLNVARSTVTQWECGWSMPRMGKLRLIAEVFHVSYSDIVSEEVRTTSGSKSSMVPLITIDEVPHFLSGSSTDELEDSGYVVVEKSSNHIIEVPTSLLDRHPKAIALIIEDNYMDRVAPRGLAMIFDPSLKPSNGQVAILHTEYQGTIVRRWFRGSNTLMLVADSHKKHDDIIITDNSTVDVYGTAVWVQSPHELE